MKSFVFPEFHIIRDEAKCGQCRGCERQCAFGTHTYDPVQDRLISDDYKCAGCQRCVVFCPKDAIEVRPTQSPYRQNASWSREKMEDLKKQAETGGVILTGCGNDKPFRIYWDHIVLNASQVTNPSIDPCVSQWSFAPSLAPSQTSWISNQRATTCR
jgi:Fe-S-cluster-containing hydrogenase component 2